MANDTIIFGIYPVEEALKKSSIDKVFIQQGTVNDKIQNIIQQLDKYNVSIQYVPIEKLNRLTRGNHQGIIAFTTPIKVYSLEDVVENLIKDKQNPLLLILDQISDVRNFGAILRTAECTGIDAIIIPKMGAAPITGDAVKTSAGALYNLPIIKVDHVKDAVFYLQGSGIEVIAATEKTNDSIYSKDLTGPLAIIMGSEGKGISNSVLSIVDQKASLPLLGEINSLNVSVACGAILYEAVRQRLKL